MTWSPADLPDLTGKTAVITGPSLNGVGFHTALEMARVGAQVVLAGRTWSKLDAAEAAIRAEVSGARTEKVAIDLSDLTSVRAGAAAIADVAPVDVLVNNAGIMATPPERTVDGLERQLATNHFGPFLLTGLLLPAIVESGAGRVVTVTSIGHLGARRAPLSYPTVAVGRYSRTGVYGETKLANLLFSYELDRRLRTAGLPVTSLASHPGFATTHLIVNGSSLGPLTGLADRAYPLIAQTPARGAWPSLMAATADLPGGILVGPGNLTQTQGPPKVVRSSRLSHDRAAAQALWELSEQTTGISYP